MLGKAVKVGKDRWVRVVEYPDGSLGLEGIKLIEMWDETYHNKYRTIGIRFSREAVRALIPLMQTWLDEVDNENEDGE